MYVDGCGGAFFLLACLPACIDPGCPTNPNQPTHDSPPPPPHTDLFKAGKGPDPKVAKAERAKSNLDTEMDAYWEAKKK